MRPTAPNVNKEQSSEPSAEQVGSADKSAGGLGWLRVRSLTARFVRGTLHSKIARAFGVLLVLLVIFIATQRTFIAAQIASYVTDSRSPETPTEWLIDGALLRSAAEASRGTHNADGEIRHTVDYPYQLLAALETPTFSVEANVTVVDGMASLQHDPRVPMGMSLLDFLEYAAIAEFPIVKLDIKRDLVGPIMSDVQEAVDRFGLDPQRVHFNANVFRGPGVENDIFGARSDKSFTDRMYNLMVMELETSDLVRIAGRFPDSTIVISSTTATGPLEAGYTQHHLEQFVSAAAEVRKVNPDQSLVFAVRGDLAAMSGAEFVEGLAVVDNSYIAAWWSGDVPSQPQDVETLQDLGVTFMDFGQERGH